MDNFKFKEVKRSGRDFLAVFEKPNKGRFDSEFKTLSSFGIQNELGMEVPSISKVELQKGRKAILGCLTELVN